VVRGSGGRAQGCACGDTFRASDPNAIPARSQHDIGMIPPALSLRRALAHARRAQT